MLHRPATERVRRALDGWQLATTSQRTFSTKTELEASWNKLANISRQNMGTLDEWTQTLLRDLNLDPVLPTARS
jgi:hypothetical protein